MTTFEDQNFGHYREVAFTEELFCAQTVFLGPGCFYREVGVLLEGPLWRGSTVLGHYRSPFLL